MPETSFYDLILTNLVNNTRKAAELTKDKDHKKTFLSILFILEIIINQKKQNQDFYEGFNLLFRKIGELEQALGKLPSSKELSETKSFIETFRQKIEQREKELEEKTKQYTT